MRSTFSMDEILMVLVSDWYRAMEVAPELSKEILYYYTTIWNKDEEASRIEEYAQAVWDGLLSSPCYPFDIPWSEMFDKVKVLYIAVMLRPLKHFTGISMLVPETVGMM